MTDKTSDEELLFADQILDLLNDSDENEEEINETTEEPIQTKQKKLQLIDDNEDIFGAKPKLIDKSADKCSVEELFGHLSDEEFESNQYLSKEGKSIAENLKTDSRSVSLFETKSKDKSKSFWNQKSQNSNPKTNEEINRDVFSGIRLINPLISSQRMKELMNGRKMVKMSLIKSQINKTTNDIDGDWVTIGIVIGKVAPKVSKNGKQYSIWKLSDLKTKNVVSFFLFGDVYAEHWKIPVSSVVGLLNPKIMSDDKYEKKSKYGKNEICSLTVDNSAKLLLMGTAKDMGYCKAIKNNQEVCGALINLAEEDYCVYHIKTAYKRFSSKRAEIQTTFSNSEPKKFQMNANNGLFASSFDTESKDMPIIETKKFNSTQFKDKKDKELENLSKIVKNPISKAARNLSLSVRETKEQKMNNKPPLISAKDVFNSIKREKNDLGFTQFCVPTLAKGYKSGQMIDLSSKSDSKLKAIQLLKAKPLPTEDPNAIKKNKNKRSLEKIISKIDSELQSSGDCEESEEEKRAKKLKNDLIEKALNCKSIHDNEVEIAEMKAQNKYFTSLEKKEKMEEKLSQIYEMECHVISCHVCKYTAHSASELCKKSGHKLVRHKATKRFFKCKNCKNRSFAFNLLLPTKPCSKCGQSSYAKTSIIKVSDIL